MKLISRYVFLFVSVIVGKNLLLIYRHFQKSLLVSSLVRYTASQFHVGYFYKIVMEVESTKSTVLDGRNYLGVLDGIRVYYPDSLSLSKARKIGIRMALSKIYNGERVSTVIIPDEDNSLSPWQKKLKQWREKYGKEAWI